MKKIGNLVFTSIVIFLILIFNSLSAQDYLFISKASKYKVSRFEEFEISFTLNAQGSGFKEPKNLREKFIVISGPNSSTFTSFSNAGLKIEQTFSYVVMPKKIGIFKISEAYINVGGKTISSKPLEIEVTNTATDENYDPNDPKNIAKKLAFVKTKIAKNNFYVGEVFTIDYLLYYRTGIGNIELLNEPDFKGFYTEVVKDQQSSFQETVNGELFNVIVLKRILLFGQKAGKFNPGALEVRIPTEVQTGQRDIFNPFFRTTTIVNQVSVFQLPTLTIKELPPYNLKTPFSGAVGKIKFKTEISKSEVKVGDAVSLNIIVEGNGNLRMIRLPDVSFPVQFDVYEPKKSEKISVTSMGMSGVKKVEYILIPKYNGEYNMPGLCFTYFDPEQSRYFELKSDDFKVKVSGGEEYIASNTETREPTAVKGSDYLSKDILFIKTTSRWKRLNESIPFNLIFRWWVITLIIGLTIGGFIALAKRMLLPAIFSKVYFKKEISIIFTEAEKNHSDPKDRLNLINQKLHKLFVAFDSNMREKSLKDNTLIQELYYLFKVYSEQINKVIFSGCSDEELSRLYKEIKNEIFDKLNIQKR